MIYPLPQKLTLTTLPAAPMYLAIPEYKGFKVKLFGVRESLLNDSLTGATKYNWKHLVMWTVVILVFGLAIIIIYNQARRRRNR